MTRTAPRERVKDTAPLQAQAEQTAPPASKTADELHAEVMRLESELESAPARVQQLRAIAQDSLDDAKMTDALLTAREIEEVTVPMLKIKIWHANRAYLMASLEETRTLETKLADEVAQVREEMTQAERAVKAATAQRDAVTRKFKTAAGSWRGAGMNAQQLAGDLQKIEREKPQL